MRRLSERLTTFNSVAQKKTCDFFLNQKEYAEKPAGRQPTNFSEWQLLAVLHRANLLQYYDDFIAQGGDDINQFMTCDEHEFLEIMSVVGMASKPLHVRRFQRTLTEFSKDPDAFNLMAIQQIGIPPMGPYGIASPSSATLNPATALQFLMSTSGLGLTVAASLPNTSPSTSHGRNSPHVSTQQQISSSESVLEALTTSVTSASVGATANVLAGDFLTNLVGVPQTTSSASTFSNHDTTNTLPTTTPITSLLGSTNHATVPSHSIPSSPGNTDSSYNEYDQSPDNPILTDAQIGKLAQCSIRLIERMPQFEPKLIQNKKKISRELLEVLQLPAGSPQRLQEYRKYSAIYGRFDAKRKPDKPLSLHEVSVNEAAAQLCLRQPALLTRRDELFPLARQVVKDAGYNYVKGIKKSDSEIRKKLALSSDSYTSEPSQSPRSSLSDGSPPPTEEYAPDSGGEVVSTGSGEVGNSRKRRRQDSVTENTADSNSLFLSDRWGSAKKASDCSLDDNS
uniref:NGFI-A-binding protein homolog n=1 Tax=Syphacia muris TaxID=451379 RepID=A0A0N5ATC4_9BILA